MRYVLSMILNLRFIFVLSGAFFIPFFQASAMNDITAMRPLSQRIKETQKEFDTLYAYSVRNNLFFTEGAAQPLYINNIALNLDLTQNFNENGPKLFRLTSFLEDKLNDKEAKPQEKASARNLLTKITELFFLGFSKRILAIETINDKQKSDRNETHALLDKLYHYEVPGSSSEQDATRPFACELARTAIMLFFIDDSPFSVHEKEERLVTYLCMVERKLNAINLLVGDNALTGRRAKQIGRFVELLKLHFVAPPIVTTHSVKRGLIIFGVTLVVIGIIVYLAYKFWPDSWSSWENIKKNFTGMTNEMAAGASTKVKEIIIDPIGTSLKAQAGEITASAIAGLSTDEGKAAMARAAAEFTTHLTAATAAAVTQIRQAATEAGADLGRGLAQQGAAVSQNLLQGIANTSPTLATVLRVPRQQTAAGPSAAAAVAQPAAPAAAAAAPRGPEILMPTGNEF